MSERKEPKKRKTLSRRDFLKSSTIAGLGVALAGKALTQPAEKPETASSSKNAEAVSIKITILYDNYALVEGTTPDWGFACLIEGTEKTILFDTGTKKDIFWENIQKLGLDITKVDAVVISHLHGDHTGGLLSFLDKKKGLPVYVPGSDPNPIVDAIQQAGGRLEKVKAPVEICNNVLLTGELGTEIKEISLVINTAKGAVLVTGCAHPGIIDITKKAGEVLGKKVYFIMGGFHLYQVPEDGIKSIIVSLRDLGVEKCGATHCTGDKAIRLFNEAFGARYVPLGVGKVIQF